MDESTRAVVTVIGCDRKGIIARVSGILFSHDINILDISQTVTSGYFNMILIADLAGATCTFDALKTELNDLGIEMGLQIRIQLSDIFDAMYNI